MPFDTHVLDDALVQRAARLEEERQHLLARTVAALDLLSDGYGIRRAYIFGSVVRRRRFHHESDVDIALETSRPDLLPEAIGRFSSLLERDVDLIDLARVPFADRIRREGILWTPKSSSYCRPT